MRNQRGGATSQDSYRFYESDGATSRDFYRFVKNDMSKIKVDRVDMSKYVAHMSKYSRVCQKYVNIYARMSRICCESI